MQINSLKIYIPNVVCKTIKTSELNKAPKFNKIAI
jgi:hypothetical protein